MLRKKTSAPSDWKRILPLAGNASLPSLASLPFTYCHTCPSRFTSSTTFQSPCGFSSSLVGSRKPVTFLTSPLLKRSILDALPSGSVTRAPGFPVRTNTSQRCAIGHPEIARAALVDLKLDRARPHLVGTLNVVENAAIARLALPRSKGSLAPFEFGAQIVILVVLFSDDVTEFSSGDMNNAMFHSEDMVGIGVQAIAAQECIELIQILAVEVKGGWAVGRNVLGLPVGECEHTQRRRMKLLIFRWLERTLMENEVLSEPILIGRSWGRQADAS